MAANMVEPGEHETSLPREDSAGAEGPTGQAACPRAVIPNPRSDPEDGLSEPQPHQHEPSLEAMQPEPDYPTGWKFWVIFLGLFLAILCQGLGRTIISTAIPKITSDFNSLHDVGWYGSSYLLTSSCFQLMLGKLYAEFPIKTVFVVSNVLFQGGSIICGAAPNSFVFILGRAIAGLGGAGISTGALIIVAHSAPVENRSSYTGMLGAATGIASSVAQTLGGVLTDKASWRWCFWINPIMGVPTFIVMFFLSFPRKAPETDKTWYGFLGKLDLLGTAFLLPGLVCLLLALEWGGNTYPWNSWRCILLLCMFGVLIVIWGFVQVKQGDKATVPIRIMKNRSMIAAAWFLFCVSGALTTFIYYGSIWFQSVRNESAYWSGIDFLAMTIPLTLASISSGFLAAKVIGCYVPQMLADSVILSTGCGLAYGGFNTNTSTGYWIATLILIGMGFGIGSQLAMAVPQQLFSGPDISLGIAIVVFALTLSPTVMLSVADNIFDDQLFINLQRIVPNVDAKSVIDHGASGIVADMSEFYDADTVQGILQSYNLALKDVWLVCLVLGCVSFLGSASVEWKRISKPQKQAQKPDQASSSGHEYDVELVSVKEYSRSKSNAEFLSEEGNGAKAVTEGAFTRETSSQHTRVVEHKETI